MKVHTQHAHDPKKSKASLCENVDEPTLHSSLDVTSGSNAALWEPPKNLRTKQRSTTRTKQKSTTITKQRSTGRTKKTKPRLHCEKCGREFASVHFFKQHEKKCVQEPETSTSCSCTCTCTTCTSRNGSTCTCSTCPTTSHETSDENRSFTESNNRIDEVPTRRPEKSEQNQNLQENDKRSEVVKQNEAVAVDEAQVDQNETRPYQVGTEATSTGIQKVAEDEKAIKCLDCEERGSTNAWLRVHRQIWHDVVQIEIKDELMKEVDHGSIGPVVMVKNRNEVGKAQLQNKVKDLNNNEVTEDKLADNTKNESTEDDDKTELHADVCEKNQDNPSDEDEAAEKAMEMKDAEDKTGPDTHKDQENIECTMEDVERNQNSGEQEASAGESMGNPNLLLGPGYTVEVASDNANESVGSQGTNSYENKITQEEEKTRVANESIGSQGTNRYEDKTTQEEEKTSCVSPEIYFLCGLCGGCIPISQGRDWVYLHAMEKHNGEVKGNCITWLRKSEGKSQTPSKESKSKKKDGNTRKPKAVQRRERKSAKMDPSEDAFEMDRNVDGVKEATSVSSQNTRKKKRKKKTKNKTDSGPEKKDGTPMEGDENDFQNQTEAAETSKKCDQCHRKFKSEALLKNHRIFVEGKLVCREVDNLSLKCEPCNRLFASEGMLHRHVRSCPKSLKCYLCDMVFTKQTELRKHLQAKHSDYVVGKKGKAKATSFPECDLCGKFFMSTANLKVHKATVHKESVIECEDETKSGRDGTRIDDKKASKVTFDTVVEYIQENDDDDNAFMPNLVIPRKSLSKQEKAKLEEEEAEKDTLKSQYLIDSVVEECPTLPSLAPVVRDTSENLVEKNTDKEDDVEMTKESQVSNALPRTKTRPPLSRVPGGYPVCHTVPDVGTKDSRVVNDDGGEEIPLFIEDESGSIQEVPNQSESTEESDQGKAVTNVQVDKTEKGKKKKRKRHRMTPIQEEVLTNLVNDFDSVNIDKEKHVAEVPCLSDMSLDEYNDIIAQLVNDYDEKMKQPVEETNFTVVGSNLLPTKPNGEVLGTVTDQMLMLLQTSNKDEAGKEDSTDE